VPNIIPDWAETARTPGAVVKGNGARQIKRQNKAGEYRGWQEDYKQEFTAIK
jgi:hypothetical protein